MPQADPPKPAKLLSFPTGRPTDDLDILDALDLLSRIAGRAMVEGADPSALVSPDHTLLLLCDCVIMAKRQHDQLHATWQATVYSDPDAGRAKDDWLRAERTVKRLLIKLRKLSATTPAGLFAKAAAVSRTGSTAAAVAISLADDLLASAELRRAVWAAADEK